MEESLTLKWGTLKQWNLDEAGPAFALLKRWAELGHSRSAPAYRDTPEQKQLICQMIDLMPGDIYLEWFGKYVSHEEAKKYVMEYDV